MRPGEAGTKDLLFVPIRRSRSFQIPGGVFAGLVADAEREED